MSNKDCLEIGAACWKKKGFKEISSETLEALYQVRQDQLSLRVLALEVSAFLIEGGNRESMPGTVRRCRFRVAVGMPPPSLKRTDNGHYFGDTKHHTSKRKHT